MEVFKKGWEVLKGDLLRVFHEFHANRAVNHKMNSTYICLIPKKVSSLKIKDFRPISLVTSLYKVVAKVLAARLREVLGETVGMAQGAFVKGRQILDLILIANEGVEEYQEKKKKGVVFKVDFEKAYDHVKWEFIDQVLERKGFGSRWRKWMKGCLSSMNFSVMINGRPRGNFKASRGIRQGDPLSPFLFVLVADVLNRLMERARERNLIEGFEIGRDKVKLSHLQFADDTIFFLKEGEHNIKNVLDILKVFGMVSGLKLNLSKSTIVGINLSEEEMSSLERTAGCEAGSWPMSYLGMPLGDNPNRLIFWNPVVEKISKRLSGWLKGCLSRGGRLTLIQSVLESIPLYYLSLFRAPVAVINQIEKLLRSFLWEGVEEGKKDHLVGWNTVTRSKEKGGLGIGNIGKKNEALLGKWLWRFPLEQDTLWCSIIRSKYGLNENGWDSKEVSRGTYRNPWKAISYGLASFNRFIRSRVGMGNKTRFWEDTWVGNYTLSSLFPRLYRISCNKNSVLSSLVSWTSSHSFSWDISFRRNLQDREFSDLINLQNIINGFRLDRFSVDKRIWEGEKSGCFSCKSFFNLLSSSPNTPPFEPCKFLWKTGIPPKVKIFAWMASWKRINTCEVIQSRRPNRALSPSWCVMCKRDNECVDHLLLHCSFSQRIWSRLRRDFQVVGGDA